MGKRGPSRCACRTEFLGPIKNKPVQLANGDILSPRASRVMAAGACIFERSTDGAKTWTATPAVNDGKEIGAIQRVLFHKDGNFGDWTHKE